MLDKTRSAKLEDCAKSTTWVMPLRILSKFFIIIMRLNNAANIAKHRKRKTTRHPFRTIVHKIAKNLCVFVLSYRRLIREDGDHGSSLGGVDLVRLKRVDLVRRVCGTIPWKVSAADQVRHRRGKEKLEEKMGMDATAARGKGVLWCPGEAPKCIARGKSAHNSPWRESYQRSHTHPGRGSRES